MKLKERFPRFLMVFSIVLALGWLGQMLAASAQQRILISTARKNKMIAKVAANFSNNIQWPKQSKVRDRSQPFIIGIVGNKAQLTGFKGFYVKKRIQNKVVLVKLINKLEEINDCDLLFFSAGDKRDHGMIIASLEKRPVLTIGEGPEFLRLGGHISLTFTGFQLQFAMQIVSLKNSNLRASVYLLKSSDKVVRGK